MKDVIEKLSKLENGFKPIEIEALKIFRSETIENAMILCCELLKHEKYQIRSLAVFILGLVASKNLRALHILKTEVSKDSSWQVQEILAKAFDQYCNDNGYEKSLPIIKEWLSDKRPNVCRAVTEGLRIWTSRPYFKDNPKVAISLISAHKASDSDYLRKSVGNSLGDISKKYNDLIEEEISGWDLSDKKISFTYKYVTKNQKK
ncbi:DNA alkylation repair protein [Maribacter sp. X9]|uniref:DNA alkylation repair protein n=1 Tax=Maribacter sp. X9 TaxID=3402159 RepID=UPI003AF38776